MNKFSEKDWKIFRSKIAGWQEAYMDKLNKNLIEFLSSCFQKNSIKTQKKLIELLNTQREYVSLVKLIHSIYISLQAICFESKFCIQ